MTPAQLRASLIIQVRSGQLTAQAAAQQLNISRQAYYQWERRALQALLQAMEEQPAGRPPKPTDPQKDQLQLRVQELERKLALHEQRDQLRALLKELREPGAEPGSATQKKSK